MNAGEHCTEDDLIALVEASSEPGEHIETCTECHEKLDSFRAVMAAIEDESVWDLTSLREDAVPQTIANLRAFATQMATEDTQAEAYLRELLEGSREVWLSRLHEHPEYRTAGVVRKLIASASEAIDTMPPDALAMTTLATEIADHLDVAAYASDTVLRLRGAAWRERAYALFYTGAFSQAEAALCASESNLSDCQVNEYELARVGIVRALVERSLERFADAMATARKSAATFERFADVTRTISARLAEVQVRFSRGEFADALPTLRALDRKLQRLNDGPMHALVLGNLGYCSWKLGRIVDALQYQDSAAGLFDDLGMPVEAVRTRWTTASTLSTAGCLEEAMARFRFVHQEFMRLGMESAATLASLEIAELLVTRNDFDGVEKICTDAMRSFEVGGLTHTSRALTALSLMREATTSRHVTPKLVRGVRDYLRRLPEEPNLLFAPPLD